METGDVFLSERTVAEQWEYMHKVRAINADYEKQFGCRKKCLTQTFGCQQNENDTERINGMLAEMGYVFTTDRKEADLILFNTCAVREHAEQKVFGTVGSLAHLKDDNPSLIICLCGCMVSQAHICEDIRKKYRHVDLVFNTNALYRFPQNLFDILTNGGRHFDTEQQNGVIAENLPIKHEDSLSAWVSVMYGCNNFCSYCIVPYVRGRERSRQPSVVLDEVKTLIASGCKDITLLGQNVNSYCKDMNNGYDFSDLLRECNAIDGDFRIKFMTSHPKDASKKLIDTVAECEKVSKHIHLPFQSGSDNILSAMNRRYTSESYISLIDYAKKTVPNVSFTSDVIVGFPGETDEDFEKTLELVRTVEFTGLYTFIYSKRKGTPAAEMKNQIPPEIKAERFDRLLKLQTEISAKVHRSYIGKTERVLVDRYDDADLSRMYGRTMNDMLVRFSKNAINCVPGNYADVLIDDALNWAAFGKAVK